MFRKSWWLGLILLWAQSAHAITYVNSVATMGAQTPGPFPGQQYFITTPVPNVSQQWIYNGTQFFPFQFNSGTVSPTPTATNTATNTPTVTATKTATNTSTITATNTVTNTATNTATATASVTPVLNYAGNALISFFFNPSTGYAPTVGATYTVTATPTTFIPSAVGVTMITIAYQNPVNGAGGNLVSTATPYPMNTLIENDGSVAGNISANGWTLASGTYKVIGGSFPFYQSGVIILDLYDITDSAIVAQTQSGFSNTSSPGNIPVLWIPGQTFTIAGTKTFKVYALNGSNGGSTNTMGFACNCGVSETYGTLCLQKTN